MEPAPPGLGVSAALKRAEVIDQLVVDAREVGAAFRNWPQAKIHDTIDAKLARDAVWEEPTADCRQEIVLIGTNMNRKALTLMLDDALLTPEEFNSSPSDWGKNFRDAFPKWEMGLMS